MSQSVLLRSALLVVTTLTVFIAAQITEDFYGTNDCSGSPTSSYQHTAGACTLGGLVYQCESSRQCLEIRVYDTTDGGRRKASADDGCSGTLLSSEGMACDECTGGSDTTVSTIVKGCNSAHPSIQTCFGSGSCSSGCNSDSGNLTLGCLTGDNGTAVDVRVVPCSAVLMQDYENYDSCSGSMLSQSVFAGGICTGGMMWRC
ncbi:GPI-anchored surface protein, putative [Bodo saltans]|uniref:GPI-anchored surface protein, putative n=1 Tax=Bodo saltans TaxID=75058 RepID=A0A0S4JGH7_BODSA|nr:GPI-anchored surface protein, putative [Bodo saltans]|eukprot:CUG89628.1 GPI-anchored surface protein, putative [Bodo saltans]